mmetsp:Transcript_108155/g.293303  ORF Transcript_108155/g.293303 Transcript_108155/m.293303 type:complete len:220 (+) Transcript_108155:16-675(+)
MPDLTLFCNVGGLVCAGQLGWTRRGHDPSETGPSGKLLNTRQTNLTDTSRGHAQRTLPHSVEKQQGAPRPRSDQQLHGDGAARSTVSRVASSAAELGRAPHAASRPLLVAGGERRGLDAALAAAGRQRLRHAQQHRLLLPRGPGAPRRQRLVVGPEWRGTLEDDHAGRIWGGRVPERAAVAPLRREQRGPPQDTHEARRVWLRAHGVPLPEAHARACGR